MRDETEYWDMVAGARLDMGTTAIEYIGEFNWEENDNGTDDSLEDWTITLPSGATIDMSEVMVTDGPWTGRLTVADEWHGITHDTINSGYLIRMTNDNEGAYVARHWGK